MSAWPPENEISFDSNVFIHMWSRDEHFNSDGHISRLFAILILRRAQLCVDASEVIREEYKRVVEPFLTKSWQIGSDLEALRYWMHPDNQIEIDVSESKELLRKIRSVIVENERCDHTFVAVALSQGRPLVTNDDLHIVRGHPTEYGKVGSRRVRIMKETKKYRAPGGDILYSSEAMMLSEGG